MAASARFASSNLWRSILGRLKSQQEQHPFSSSGYGASPCGFRFMSSGTSSKLFVGGLSWSLDENALRDAFSSYGEIIEAKVILDRETGRSRGFGFVSFMSSEDAESARNSMDGHNLNGRNLRVSFAIEKPPPTRTFGGFGGGGDMGYGGSSGNSSFGETYSRPNSSFSSYGSRDSSDGGSFGGKDSFGSDSFGGKDSFGSDSFSGKDSFGSGSFGDDSFGKDNFGSRSSKDSFGSGSFGNDSFGSDSFGSDFSAKDSYGSKSFGNSSIEDDSVGNDLFQDDSFGTGGKDKF